MVVSDVILGTLVFQSIFTQVNSSQEEALTCTSVPSFDFLTPVWNHLPKWLAQTKYRTPVDSAHTAFHHVYKTSEDSQTFISKHPEYNNHSASNLGGTRTSWIDIYPIQDKLKDEERKNETSSTFVEIGGGLQREVSTLISRFPHLSLFVLQHSPAAVSNLELDGIEVIAHDILEPQPIRGLPSV